jgi:predicted amidohydrolase
MPVRVAVAQLRPSLAAVDANLARCVRALEESAAAGAALVVLPECAVTGYMFGRAEEALAVAQPLDGPAVETLAEACARLRLHAVAGRLERDGGALHNTAVLVGPEGVVGSYRKSHLPYLGVDRFCVRGDLPPQVYDTPAGCVGIAICYDLRFPELTRGLALEGAELICHPTNWPPAADVLADVVIRARAVENRVYVLAADRVGREGSGEFIGRSQIVDPTGRRLVEAGASEERVLVADVDPAEARRKALVTVPGEYEVDFFGDRRPELYRALTEPASAAGAPVAAGRARAGRG